MAQQKKYLKETPKVNEDPRRRQNDDVKWEKTEI